MDTLRKIFPYLTCDRVITGKDKRACLYYDIGLCIAPCIGAASKDDYRSMIDALCKFLQGKNEEVTGAIRAKLDAAVQKLEFERAARYRDQLQALARIAEHQKVVSPLTIDQDVIAFAREVERRARDDRGQDGPASVGDPGCQADGNHVKNGERDLEARNVVDVPEACDEEKDENVLELAEKHAQCRSAFLSNQLVISIFL